MRFAVDVKNEKIILLPQQTSPGIIILGDLLSGEINDQAMYALAHLVSGKNLVFYGAPGTGKTRIAVKICEKICSANNFSVETANSEWSNFEIIGGYMPDEKGNPAWHSGIFSSAVEKCTANLKVGKPYWLVLDELNRELGSCIWQDLHVAGHRISYEKLFAHEDWYVSAFMFQDSRNNEHL